MASPEVLDSSGTMVSVLNDELSAPEGWTKKLMPRKAGTPKRKDVIYIAPDGEEIKNKKQLDKYLKMRPGGPSSADFDWSTGETPRRSARLSCKGRLSSDSTEAEPITKRSRRSLEERSPGSSITPSRKGRKSQRHADTPAKDEVMQDFVKEQDEGATEGTTVLSGAGEVEALTEEGKKCDEERMEDDAKGAVTATAVAVADAESAGQPTKQLGSSEELGSGAVKVIAEERVLPAEGTSQADLTQDTVMTENATSIEEEKVETTVLEAGVTEGGDPLNFAAVDAVDEVTKFPEGEISLKKENLEVEETLDAPQNLEGKELDTPVLNCATKDEDSLKPKDHVESQGIHALIEESVLCGANKPEHTSESPLPAAGLV